MSVNLERLQLLLDALRSDEFTQGRGLLAVRTKQNNSMNYCCLGVACEVARRNGLNLTTTSQGSSDPETLEIYSYGTPGDVIVNFEAAVLPKVVKDWYGFDRVNPSVALPSDMDGKGGFPRLETPAYYANDVLRMTLSEIADAFERRYFPTTDDPDAE